MTKDEMMDRIVELERRVNESYMEGYRRGETERIWLAQANSELRSELHDLKEAVKHGR
jgi:hypothetical protein